MQRGTQPSPAEVRSQTMLGLGQGEPSLLHRARQSWLSATCAQRDAESQAEAEQGSEQKPVVVFGSFRQVGR